MDWKSSTLPMNYPVRACLPSRTSYGNVKRRKENNGWNVTQRNATRRSKYQTSQVDRGQSKVNLWVFRCHHPIRLEIQMGNDFTQTQARKRKKKIGTKKKIKNRENGLRKERVVLWCRKKNDTRLNRIYAKIYIEGEKSMHRLAAEISFSGLFHPERDYNDVSAANQKRLPSIEILLSWFSPKPTTIPSAKRILASYTNSWTDASRRRVREPRCLKVRWLLNMALAPTSMDATANVCGWE